MDPGTCQRGNHVAVSPTVAAVTFLAFFIILLGGLQVYADDNVNAVNMASWTGLKTRAATPDTDPSGYRARHIFILRVGHLGRRCRVAVHWRLAEKWHSREPQ